MVESLWDVGGHQYLHAGLLESSHRQFKRSCHLNSKRTLPSMDETVEQQTRANLDRTFLPGTPKEPNKNRMRFRTVEDSSTDSVQSGLRTMFERGKLVQRHLFEMNVLEKSQIAVNNELRAACECIR